VPWKFNVTEEGFVPTTESFASLSPIKKIILIAFSLLLSYFGVHLLRYHYLVVTHPYPLEYSEGAMLLTTDMLLHGENPYALENMPVAMNVYGIVYHFVVYPFARLWGATFLVHRAVSAVFILLSCIFFFVILRRHGINKLYSLSAVLILYASLLYRYTSISKPDGFGFFLFLLSAFIAYLMQYSTLSLVISVFLGILAFYTKAYFVLPIPYLAFYLFLFVSKKKAILYGMLAFLLLATTALIVNQIFETYFVNTFFNHINVAANDLKQLRAQLEFFSLYNSGILLVLIVYSLLFVFDKVPSDSLRNPRLETVKQRPVKWINVFHFDEPLFRVNFSFPLYCFIFSFAIFYFKLGRHYGNLMTYAYQLITPFFLICAYSLSVQPLRDIRLVKRRDIYNYSLLLPCILISLYLLSSSATSLRNSPEWTDVRDWQRAEQITRSYKNIMNSRVLASLLLAQDKPLYDTGQTEFFQYSHYPYEWLDGLLLSNRELSMQWTAYENSIHLAVEREEFDAVIIAPSEHRSYLANLEKHYTMIDTIELCMFHTAQCLQLEIWRPGSSTQ
jgi:hypothetical protein